MNAPEVNDKKRKRAPSKRSLETRDRIFGAAESLFAARGFEGASIRDIAKAASVQTALVNHHGGAKEVLFATIVARRAEPLAAMRREALAQIALEGLTDKAALQAILAAFMTPLLEKAEADEGWRAYARLVAQVSADARWSDLAARYFDPTALHFITVVRQRFPESDASAVAEGFVFTVSSMLALSTSRWRIAALAGHPVGQADNIGNGGLITYTTAGYLAMLTHRQT